LECAIAFPQNKDEVTDWLKQWRSKYEKANHIVFVGGGAVVSNLQARSRIAFRWAVCLSDLVAVTDRIQQEKKITIVQGDSKLATKPIQTSFAMHSTKASEQRCHEIVYNDFRHIRSEAFVECIAKLVWIGFVDQLAVTLHDRYFLLLLDTISNSDQVRQTYGPPESDP